VGPGALQVHPSGWVNRTARTGLLRVGGVRVQPERAAGPAVSISWHRSRPGLARGKSFSVYTSEGRRSARPQGPCAKPILAPVAVVVEAEHPPELSSCCSDDARRPPASHRRPVDGTATAFARVHTARIRRPARTAPTVIAHASGMYRGEPPTSPDLRPCGQGRGTRTVPRPAPVRGRHPTGQPRGRSAAAAERRSPAVERAKPNSHQIPSTLLSPVRDFVIMTVGVAANDTQVMITSGWVPSRRVDSEGVAAGRRGCESSGARCGVRWTSASRLLDEGGTYPGWGSRAPRPIARCGAATRIGKPDTYNGGPGRRHRPGHAVADTRGSLPSPQPRPAPGDSQVMISSTGRTRRAGRMEDDVDLGRHIGGEGEVTPPAAATVPSSPPPTATRSPPRKGLRPLPGNAIRGLSDLSSPGCAAPVMWT